MNIRILVVFLLAIVILVGVSRSSASAEGGWVLWIKSEKIFFEKGGLPRETKDWEITGALPKFEQCLEMQKKTWANRKSFWNDRTTNPGGKKAEGRQFDLLFINITNNNDEPVLSITETLMCLPSPLDPRERK